MLSKPKKVPVPTLRCYIQIIHLFEPAQLLLSVSRFQLSPSVLIISLLDEIGTSGGPAWSLVAMAMPQSQKFQPQVECDSLTKLGSGTV